MVFPRSLKTDEMTLYVLENFEWDQREVAFPHLPLLYDYKDLCPEFDLTTAEGVARDFLLPERPQVVFWAMLLNDAVKLGVLRRGMVEIMESTFVELWGNILRARCLVTDSDFFFMASPLVRPSSKAEVVVRLEGCRLGGSASEAMDISSGLWARYRTLSYAGMQKLPRSLHFDLAVAKEATYDPKMIQAVFYAMVVNEALELSVLSRDLAKHLKSALEGLRCSRSMPFYGSNTVNPRLGSGSASGQEENSVSSDAPPLSSYKK
ncbi:LOW QUALITY PROTEIN: hypothetical protein Cgig2_011778 [Carnegiea gigantea]|uniref:Uncharacterized protein n=1 Tax=Carnegiea gigantea TaxID=171969 RepID=A0A9Q1JIX5_9CARY|nr:LOW QUALITY PROTEIN: hypothetical protein Cgig2_011778 [Carnegiea gigantea]